MANSVRPGLERRLRREVSGEVAFDLHGCETQAVEQLGDRAFVYLQSTLGPLVLLAPGDGPALEGHLRLALDPAALHFFDAREQAVTAETPHPRPSIAPGSFKVLVVGR